MSGDNTTGNNKTGRGRKTKPPQDLDLPASAVQEITPATSQDTEIRDAEAGGDAVSTPEPEAGTPETVMAQHPETMESAPVEESAPLEATPQDPDARAVEAESPTQESVFQESPAQEAPASEAVAATPAQPSSSKLVPGMIGLVAGLVGGLAAPLTAPYLAPYMPALVQGTPTPAKTAQSTPEAASNPAPSAPAAEALLERLSKAEAAATQAAAREEAMNAKIAALDAKLASETEAARKAVNDKLDAKAAQPNPEVLALRERLGTIEGENKVIPKEIDALGTKVETLQPRLDTLQKTVEVLSGRLASVGSKDALALANGRLAAQSLLEDEFASGKPYANTLDLLKRTGAEPSLLTLLEPFAGKGAPQTKVLISEMGALKPAPAPPPPVEGGFLAQAKRAALSMVTIRRTGDAAAGDDKAVLARMETALQRGAMPEALILSDKLSPALSARFAPWRTRLEERIKAGEAVVLLRKDAQKALANAAAASAK